MNLVVGATGLLGIEICRQLKAKNKPVKALVRASSDQTKVNSLKNMGVDIIQGDLLNLSSLKKACEGVETIISTASSLHSYNPAENNFEGVDKEGQIMLIDAAKSTGVNHFIFISISGNLEIDIPFRNAKREVENHLKNSGLIYTVLRPTCFMEIWLSPALGFDFPNSNAKIYGTGKNPISWVSYKDVGKFAVESLDNPAAKNATIEIGGPEAIAPLNVVNTFEEISGKKFNIQHIPEEALKAQLANAPDPLQKTFAGLMFYYSKGDTIEMDKVLSKFQIQLTSVKNYAQDVINK